MNGVVLINKDKNMTSRDVINKLSYMWQTKKIGHTGTLDPLATGVLVVTIGKYTKLCEVLTSTYKEYVATMRLGLLTDTLDITGTILKQEECHISKEQIMTTMPSFVGTYEQEVPLYSAVKVGGKKLYEYARAKEEVKLPRRLVEIKEIEVLEIENNLITFRTVVSKGTYIRSLIRDIASSLQTIATMEVLVRTKQGPFSIDDAYTLEDIANNHYHILNLTDVLDVLVVDIPSELVKSIQNGAPYSTPYTKEFLLLRYNHRDIALYRYIDNVYKMFLLLEEK